MEKMKKIIAVALLLTIMFGGVYLNLKNVNLSRAESTEITQNTIEVNGEGKIKATPDIANITLGVVTEAKDAKTAKDENSKKMNAVIDAIKDLGVKEADIQTQNFSIYPQYDWNYVNPKTDKREKLLIGYEVRNNLDVKVRNLEIISDVIDAAIDNGANNSNNIRFSVSKQEELYLDALESAMKNAEAKAERLASVYGEKLKKPLKIVESSYGGPREVYLNNYMAKSAVMEDAVSTPIEAGELEINANVQVIFEY